MIQQFCNVSVNIYAINMFEQFRVPKKSVNIGSINLWTISSGESKSICTIVEKDFIQLKKGILIII